MQARLDLLSYFRAMTWWIRFVVATKGRRPACQIESLCRNPSGKAWRDGPLSNLGLGYGASRSLSLEAFMLFVLSVISDIHKLAGKLSEISALW
jgi:hypothetical protein